MKRLEHAPFNWWAHRDKRERENEKPERNFSPGLADWINSPFLRAGIEGHWRKILLLIVTWLEWKISPWNPERDRSNMRCRLEILLIHCKNIRDQTHKSFSYPNKKREIRCEASTFESRAKNLCFSFRTTKTSNRVDFLDQREDGEEEEFTLWWCILWRIYLKRKGTKLFVVEYVFLKYF